ncbi:hypothetical protein TNCV_4181101 [Trichonephila clavipes]|nr:hypothetical protein TNCV_4181101 [Trichonephila clavipes]
MHTLQLIQPLIDVTGSEEKDPQSEGDQVEQSERWTFIQLFHGYDASHVVNEASCSAQSKASYPKIYGFSRSVADLHSTLISAPLISCPSAAPVGLNSLDFLSYCDPCRSQLNSSLAQWAPMSRYNCKNKKLIFYPDPSAIRPVPHGPNIPVFLPPTELQKIPRCIQSHADRGNLCWSRYSQAYEG